MFPREKGRLKMDKNKKEYMFDMEVGRCFDISDCRRGTYFFWGSDDRLKWHGVRLDEHLGNVPAALVMVNCCNDLFNCLGMEFTTK